MMVATVRGEFREFAGYLEVDGDDFSAPRIEVIVKAASIDTNAADRDRYLRAAEFFNTQNFAEVHFNSTGVDKLDDDEYLVHGDLTTHGMTRHIELEAEMEGRIHDPYGNELVAISAKGEINRNDFGLNWNAPLETGGVMLADKVKLQLDVTLLRKLDIGTKAA
jgi:polyisoprenoid-binding protein YceI